MEVLSKERKSSLFPVVHLPVKVIEEEVCFSVYTDVYY